MVWQLCMMCSNDRAAKLYDVLYCDQRTYVYMPVPLQLWFKMTDQSIVCLIRLKLLCYNTSSYLLSTTSRKDRAFPHLIYSFTNTYMVTKTPRYLSLLSKYARILCRCPYTSLLHKSRLPPIIHNIPSTTLHTSFHHSTKTQNLPKFTTFLRQTQIYHTMCGQCKKYIAACHHHIINKMIKAPCSTTILT